MSDVLEQTLASPERLQALLDEAEQQLSQIQPEIDGIEAQLERLKELKQTRQRLLTLKLSLSAMIAGLNNSEAYASDVASEVQAVNTRLRDESLSFEHLQATKTFHPETALSQVVQWLKQKDSLNYEMFRAVVLNGGTATTQEIKDYMVERGLKQPQTGESFESVGLTEISSRANYLVRKGLLKTLERGCFYTHLGWIDP
jgi:chromosome segregation ATPase